MNETQKFTRKKKGKLWFLLFIVVCIAVLIFPYIKEYASTASRDGDSVVITVPNGATATDVADMLEDKGLIKTKYTFLIKYRLNLDTYKHIQSGEFVLHKGMCLNDILIKLTSQYNNGKIITITIPEGFSVEMIALRCANLGLCTEAEFINAVDTGVFDYEFIKHIPEGQYRHKLEGFLFPSTYEFFEGTTAYEIADKMLAKFEDEYSKNFSNYDNLFNNIIIASMIEREAAVDSERAVISGVIKNRLAVSMPLQIDATAVYAKTNGYYDIEVPSAEDVKFNSPYNTYIHSGLPSGPICCPGVKSILAAANPESHKYLYYHTDTTKKDGSHIFTETYEMHMAGL